MAVEEDILKKQLTQPEVSLPTLFSVSPDVIDLILDPFKVIERIRRDLRGEILTTKKLKNGRVAFKWEKIGMEVMNEKGVAAVVSILNKYVNRNSILSNLTEEEIYMIILRLDKNINALFYTHYKDFDLDPNMKSIVKDGIADMCFMALKQSQNKALLDALTKAYSIKELRGYPTDKKGGGIKDTLIAPFKKLAGR